MLCFCGSMGVKLLKIQAACSFKSSGVTGLVTCITSNKTENSKTCILMRTARFWVITQWVVVISYTTCHVITQKSAVLSYLVTETWNHASCIVHAGDKFVIMFLLKLCHLFWFALFDYFEFPCMYFYANFYVFYHVYYYWIFGSQAPLFANSYFSTYIWHQCTSYGNFR